MFLRIGAQALAIGLAFAAGSGRLDDFSGPRPVEILGYSGSAMEPFVSRDGRYLLFNDFDEARGDKDLEWAERAGGGSFRYRGPIVGVNTRAVEGAPSLDRDGTLYFISTRSYDRTLSTVYRASFRNGRAGGVRLVPGLAEPHRGLVIFDAEISADGRQLFCAEGDFSAGGEPKSATIFVAERDRDGLGFTRLRESARLLANVNVGALQYAPSTSADGLELFFTSVSRDSLDTPVFSIERATRPRTDVPFGKPRRITAINGFSEGPSISSDGLSLYFHHRVGRNFRIYRVTRDSAHSRE